jgi:hypothetical protein
MYVIGKKFSEEGVWKEYNGMKLFIAQSGNRQFRATLERLRRPYRRKIERGTLNQDVSDKLVLQAIAEGIILDWKGVVDVDGKDVSYDSEIVAKQLEDDPELLEFVMEVAADNDQYRLEEKEIVVGESEAS